MADRSLDFAHGHKVSGVDSRGLGDSLEGRAGNVRSADFESGDFKSSASLCCDSLDSFHGARGLDGGDGDEAFLEGGGLVGRRTFDGPQRLVSL